jgi:hypothetical protein
MKNNLIIIILAILIFVSGIGGYFLGQKVILNSLFPEQKEIFSIGGIITSINANSFVVETNSLQQNLPNSNEVQTDKITVNINEQTQIYRMTFSIGNPESEETAISFSDLSEGNEVSVVSSENIKGKTEIIAASITHYQMENN